MNFKISAWPYLPTFKWWYYAKRHFHSRQYACFNHTLNRQFVVRYYRELNFESIDTK